MSNDELFRAMGMFKEGMQQYATSQAIGAAAEQVNQLNNNAMDEMQKRTELTKVGNSLALHLGQIGTPASQIQSAMGAITPTPFKNASEMYGAGLQAGAPGQSLMDAAKNKWQPFEEDPKLKLAQASTDRYMAGQAMLMDRQEKKMLAADEASQMKDLTKVQDKVNVALASRSGPLGQVQKTLQRAQSLETVFRTADAKGGLSQIDKTQAEEIATTVASIISGGNPQSTEQIRNLTPQSYQGDLNAWVGKLKNEPKGLEQQKFFERLRNVANREGDLAKAQIMETYTKYLTGSGHLLDSQHAKVTSRFDKMLKGAGITREDIANYTPGGNGPIQQSIDAAGQPTGASQGTSGDRQIGSFPDGRRVFQRPDGTKYSM